MAQSNQTTSDTTAPLEFDIVIYGGSFSAPSAAFQAARMNPDARILLAEPMDWLGGQATSQGVSAIDNAWHNPGASLMRNEPHKYYPADYLNFLQRIKTAPVFAPGEGYGGDGACWVSREAFDPRTAAWVLDQMAGEYPNLTVMKLTVVRDVATTPVTDAAGAGARITEITLLQRTPRPGYKPLDKFLSEEIPDWYNPADSADFLKVLHRVVARDPQKGLVVIDASELADVIVLSGATYTVGRELTTERIAEDGTLPAHDEDGSQSFVFPFCMTGTTTPTSEDELKQPFADFADYYQQQLTGFFSLGSHTWVRVWTYRRLKNVGTPYDTNTANLGDVTMQNWYPGNDYPYGTLYKNLADTAAERADWRGGVNLADIAQAEKHAIAFYFYMKAYATRTLDTRYLHGDDSLNMMDTKHGLAKFPYIRCTRRIIGLSNYRLTERYFVSTDDPNYTAGASFRYYDSVGIGNYAEDVHPTRISTGISPNIHRPAPFYIPYRSLGSVNIRNLLTGGKTIATTFLTNSAYRLHPIEWAIGSAAGGAAALMQRDDLSNYDLLDLPRLRELQTAVNANSPISWAAYDAQPIPPQNGDLVVNSFKIIYTRDFPFEIEVYHHRAARARILWNGTPLGETTTRANGRLRYVAASVPTGKAVVTAECFDAEGNLLDTLTANAEASLPPEEDPAIVDNEDPGFSTVGAWTRASAQPDKFKTSYDYATGGSGEKTATWILYTPHPGRYDVFIWYPAAYNRATDSPFTVHHADGQTTFRINQQTNGGRWVWLGTFRFDGAGTGRVVLSNDISDPLLLVLADAVRSVPISAPHGLVIR